MLAAYPCQDVWRCVIAVVRNLVDDAPGPGALSLTDNPLNSHNVRFWLIADLPDMSHLCLILHAKQTFVAQNRNQKKCAFWLEALFLIFP